jgi:hypothetical protein
LPREANDEVFSLLYAAHSRGAIKKRIIAECGEGERKEKREENRQRAMLHAFTDCFVVVYLYCFNP